MCYIGNMWKCNGTKKCTRTQKPSLCFAKVYAAIICTLHIVSIPTKDFHKALFLTSFTLVIGNPLKQNAHKTNLKKINYNI